MMRTLHYVVGTLLTLAYVALVVGMARTALHKRAAQAAWERHLRDVAGLQQQRQADHQAHVARLRARHDREANR